ncbi:MAG: HEAT repeat domain-containing protein, partial [Proteobacteria bacterium]|nr:HEAT repeat domain-containing protein [Pseudomonadota bacterium]
MAGFQNPRIREWALEPTPDSARHLIRLYSESEWRSTRLEVVRALGHFRDPRSLPFLVDLIRRNEDLAEQDLALLSLARQKTRGSKLFLKSFYPVAPETLKPRVAYALGLARVHEASGMLLQDLADSRKRENPAFLKNLVLALGELKEFRAAPAIHEMLGSGLYEEQDIRLALLFSLGRLERDVARVTRYESLFIDESIQWQVYQSTLAQVQIRSQFKLEDYLSKIFEGENPHALLPFELRGFPWADVEAGLTIFPKKEYRERHVFCSRVFTEETREAYLRSLEIPDDEWEVFLGFLSRSDDIPVSAGTAAFFRSKIPGIESSVSLKLDWMDAFLPVVDFEALAPEVLSAADAVQSIRFLNLWSERAVGEDAAWQKKTLKA